MPVVQILLFNSFINSDVKVFVSHSRKDIDIINEVKRALTIVDFSPIVYEDLPKDLKVGPDMTNIWNLISQSDLVFIFLTQNAFSTNHTLTWIQYEDHISSMMSKPVILFQAINQPPIWPVIYFTDLVPVQFPFLDSVAMQGIAKSFKSSGALIRGGAGALLGSLFGPLGALLGLLGGLLTTPQSPLAKVPVIKCTKCNHSYRYWGGAGSLFYCPYCFTEWIYNGGV